MKKQYVFSQEEYEDAVISLKNGLSYFADMEENYKVNCCRDWLKTCLGILTASDRAYE